MADLKEYREAQKRVAKSKEDMKAHERGLRVAAALVFREVYDVGVGDVFLLLGRTEILVLGFSWPESIFDYAPKEPMLVISTKKLDGVTWGKSLSKRQFDKATMTKTGTDLEAAEELRLRV